MLFDKSFCSIAMMQKIPTDDSKQTINSLKHLLYSLLGVVYTIIHFVDILQIWQ